ncbi:MAG TPA: hypothetical protein VFH95_05910 [Candidatus Kapabacteria bacterium]|nr:hypothetical protein [Candidatus Kapabacteria bacterium]
MASILSSCSSTTSGPNTTTATEGQGRIVYMNTTLSPNPTSSSVVITDSTGTTSTTLGAGFVWSVAANRIVWDSTGGHDLDDGKGDATIMISTNSGVNKAVWKSSQAVRLASMPIISPDGLHVAFITEENTIRLHVFDVASDGMSITNDRVIDSAIHDKIMPSFSPDGSKIAYYSHIGSNQFLTIRQLNGTAIAQIPNGEDQGNIPGNVEWSPSGDKIAFGADGVIRVVNADGSNPIAVDSGGDPDWSPDGKTIAYESPYFPGHAITDIVLTSNDGATKDTLPNPSHELRFMPAWSPDGEKIICTTGSTSIEVIDVASGAAKTIASPGFTGAWLR